MRTLFRLLVEEIKGIRNHTPAPERTFGVVPFSAGWDGTPQVWIRSGLGVLGRLRH